MTKKIIALIICLYASASYVLYGQEKYNFSVQTDEWHKVAKEAYIEECVKEASKSISYKEANNYCECTLKKMMKKYPNALDADKVTEEEILELVRDCL